MSQPSHFRPTSETFTEFGTELKENLSLKKVPLTSRVRNIGTANTVICGC